MHTPFPIMLGLAQLVILPLTWMTLRALRVPQHLELVGGCLLSVVYGFLGAVLAPLFL